MYRQLRAPRMKKSNEPNHRVRLCGELLEDRTVPAFVPTGAESLVNTFTANDQQASSMAMDSNGNFVVVWESMNQFSGTSGKDIYAQRYNAAGTKVGSEFRVNTFTTNDQSGPDVAMDNAGNFVVVWTSTNQDTGNSTGVYGQRYNASGVAQGSEFRLNNVTQYDQLDPSISMDANGNFVVVWTSGTDDPLAFPAPQDGLAGLYGVYGIRYNSAGVRQGTTEFRVNNTTAGVQGLASVASDSSGNFTVAWTSTGQESGQGDSSAVFFRRYNSAGTALTSEARVNQTVVGEQFAPEIAMNASGTFVITYASSQDDLVDKRTNTYARQYNSSGTATSNEFRVNTYLPGEQYLQSAAMDSAGNFVVAWSSGYDNVANPGPELQQDGNMYGVYMQRYFANGTTDGGEYRVNSFTTGNQWLPSIAMRASTGNFWISWSSFGQDAANGYGVYLEPYGPNTLPTAVTGGPYTVAEGNSLVLNGSSVDPDFGQTVTFSWDVNGDGVYSDAITATPTLTWSQLQALGINDGPGSRTVRLRTFDGYDTTTSASTTLTITNTAPTATISSQSAAVRGEAITFTLTATDPSSVDQSASFTYQLDWNNDGIVDLTQVGGSSITVSNTYTASGVYTARVRATDKDGGVGAWASQVVTVTRSRTTVNPNTGLIDLILGGTTSADFIVVAPTNFFNGGSPSTVSVSDFNIPGDVVDTFPSVTGRIVAYMQDGDDIFVTVNFDRPELLFGGGGADTLFGSIFSDTINGGDGDDALVGSNDPSTAADILNGDNGDDFILAADGNNTINGGIGSDAILGGAGNDVIDGGDGNDALVGLDGDDSISGGNGDDFILGMAGADSLFGGAGGDLIISGIIDDNPEGTADGVIAEWWSGDTYANRVGHITGAFGGGQNPYPLAVNVNVFDDGAVDQVFGNADQDFFYYKVGVDVATDVAVGETVVGL